MRFPAYNLVDYARGDVRARNNVVEIREAITDSRDAGAHNSYITVYRFDRRYHEHVQRTGSVSGYGGPVFADYLPFDVDRDGDLAGAQRAAIKIAVTIHDVYDVRHDQLRYFFSGSKGYHILLPTSLMGSVEPSPHLPLAFRTMALGVADLAGETIDGKIYDANRLFRLADTQHAATRLWKVELTWAEFSELGGEQHRELAREPRHMKWLPHDLEPIDALAEYFAKHITEAEARPARIAGRLGDGIAKSLALALSASYSKGQRHQVVLAFAGYAAKRHLPREAALCAIEELAANDDELDDRLRAVEDTYDRVRQGSDVKGYSDLAALVAAEDLASLRDLLGDKSAAIASAPAHVAPVRGSMEHVYDADRAGDAYLRYARELSHRRITTGIPSIDRRLRGLMPGTVTTLVAKARVGKSLFAQTVRRNVGRTVQEGCSVFFSLEMPIELVWERDAQFALEQQGLDIEHMMRDADEAVARRLIAQVSRTIPRSYTVTAPNLSLDEMAEYCALIAQQFGGPVVCAIVDYLSLVRSPGRDLYTSTSHAARSMKTFAKSLQAPVIMLSQVRRRGADGEKKVDGATPPSLDDARDSGAVEEGSDSVIGAWRPRLDDREDDELHFRVLKNRLGRAGGSDIRCQVNWRKLELLELMAEDSVRDRALGRS